MDWDGSLIRSSVVIPRSESSTASSFSSFLFNCNFDQLPGNTEVKHHHPFGLVPESSQISGLRADKYSSSGYVCSHLDRKKKLTSEQLDSLEKSFQEEIKLDPDRKMMLSRALGLQPRQIAVWFQNRRARWKAKQLERLCDALKQELDAIYREKIRLQEEVLQLKSMIRSSNTKHGRLHRTVWRRNIGEHFHQHSHQQATNCGHPQHPANLRLLWTNIANHNSNCNILGQHCTFYLQY